MVTSSTTGRSRLACVTATTASRCASSRRAHRRQHKRLNAVRPPPVVELRAVAKSFAAPTPRYIFANLSLEIARGEHVAIVGASGIGKSTLLNVIAGLELVDAGSVVVDGVDVATLDDDARTAFRRERMGFVFQAFHVLPYLSVAENVALPLALLDIRNASQSARVGEMLRAVSLAGREESRPRELSGGELQRVAIARALVHRPALVLADEPTGNLDPDTGRRVIALLREAVKDSGAAVVVATHSRTAAAAADRVYRLTATGLKPASAEDIE
jgi:putative ABC transport system ATP-binding protein